MSKTLIREDADGLYANVGGWLVRPPRNRIGLGPRAIPAGTKHEVGDHVQASHSGGPLARVGGEQWWIERESDATIAAREKYAKLDREARVEYGIHPFKTGATVNAGCAVCGFGPANAIHG